ncbi:hypothetical protein [Clostridium sp.]|uniref:hypothetical protein n=1 Tax=Clostridium sp. TaxID=1506 RepID=UPI002FC679F2
MFKKLVISIIMISLCAFIVFLGYENINFRTEKTRGLRTNGLSYTLANNNDESEFSYSLQLTNTNGKSIFIENIEPVINDTIKDKILSKETVVTVNRNIEPNETIQINGGIIVDTKGLLFNDVQKLITDIKVSTVEIVNLK